MSASTTVHLRIGLMLLVHRKPPWRSDSAPRAAENGSHQPLARLGLELGTPRGSVVWRALQRLRELFEWAWVPGFVQADLAGAGDPEVRDPAPALVLDRRYELDALALEFRDGVLDVMAHEEQGVMPGPAAPAGARVYRDLTRRQGEEQPALAGIDPLEAEHVVKELPSSLGILGEDDRVCSGDHGGDRSAGYCSARSRWERAIHRLGCDRPRGERRPETASPDSRWDRAVCTKPLGAPLRVGMRDERAPRSRPPGSRLGRTASAIRWRRLAVALRHMRRSPSVLR